MHFGYGSKRSGRFAFIACAVALLASACGVDSFAPTEALKKELASIHDPEPEPNPLPSFPGPGNYLYNLSFGDQEIGERCKPFGTTQMVVTDFGGRRVCANTVKTGSNGFGTWGGTLSLPLLRRGDDIWIRVRTFYPTGFVIDNGGAMKFLRVRTRSANGHDGYNDLYISHLTESSPFKFIFEGENQWISVGQRPEHTIAYGKWETIEMHLKLDHLKESEGGHALVRVWKDGQLLLETRSRKTLKYADSEAFSFYLYSYWGNNPASLTQTMFIDDVTVSTETPANRDAAGNPFIGL